jgi:hypothetical protein
MKGDFTRNTFDPEKHFLRVLMQQGRVQLDSDWNEQASILLHYLQTLATDLIGPYAGPEADWGFEVKEGSNGDFTIGKGRYYVNGILCENDQDDITYFNQPDYPLSKDAVDDKLKEGNHIVYLDVWERHISFVEDDDIREKALNGADTATRSKVIWQVKVMPLTYQYAYCQQGSSLLTDNLLVPSQVCMSARAKQAQPVISPCLTEPEAQYRGAENQLYRVEIHNGNFDDDGVAITPTFKFSRENGSVIFPIKNVISDTASGTTSVELEHLGCNDKLGLAVDNWVEFIDDRIDLHNKVTPLSQVLAIDAVNRKVTLSGAANVDIDLSKHPFLRRWDQKNVSKLNAGVIDLTTGSWIKLEDGIEVMFSIKDAGRLRRGDYWLIPARHITGDVEWPKIPVGNGKLIPEALSPMGTLHYYAPLAIINVADGSVSDNPNDCRCSFKPKSSLCQYNKYGRLGIGTHLLRPQGDVDQ